MLVVLHVDWTLNSVLKYLCSWLRVLRPLVSEAMSGHASAYRWLYAVPSESHTILPM